MHKTMILFLTLVLLLWVCPAVGDEAALRSGDYEYIIRYDDNAEITAYYGEYLPRVLPSTLGGYEVNVDAIDMSYPDNVFSHLIKTWDIYRYAQVSEDEVWIVGYTGFQRIARIPDTIDGMKVTGIGDKAFWLSGFEREPFAEVVLVPGSVRTIGRLAFACSEIGYILLEEGLEEIGDMAFEGRQQNNFYIPASVRKMGSNPFCNSDLMGKFSGTLWLMSQECYTNMGDFLYDERDMTLISCFNYDPYFGLGEGIRVIGSYAFRYMRDMEELTLPDSVRVIEPYAFQLCENLRTVNLPDGLTEIGTGAFEYCDIREIYIPSSVSVFGDFILPDNAVIVCDRGSAAEAYAMNYRYSFRYR